MQQVSRAINVGDVTLEGADGAIVDGVTASIRASVLDLAGADPLAVAIVDTDGVQISSFGGGTQYTEDAAAAANPVGTALIMVRDDALSGQTTTDGDNVAARGTDKGELYVKHVDAIPVTDNGGSLTIDAASLPLPTDAATETTLAAVESAVDGVEGLLVTIDGDTGAIAGAVYVEGDIDASIAGVPLLWEDTSDTLRAVSAAKPLPISVATIPSHDVTNAGTFATQATLQTGDNAVGRVKLTDGTDVADILDLTSSNPLAVAIVDGGGDQITSFGGGVQYTEGDTDASITGTALLWEDAGNTLTTASASTPLPVEIVAGAGSGGTAAADDADFTAGTTSGTPVMGVFESSPTSVTDGDMGVVGITVDRRVKTSATIDAAFPAGDNNIGNVDIVTVPAPLSTTGGGTEATALRVTLATDSTGVVSVDDNGGALTVDGTVAVTGVSTLAEQQTQTTHLATIAGDTTDIETAVELIDDAIFAEDVAAQAGDKGIAVLAVRRDADTSLVGTDNDYANLQVNANGALKVEVFDGGDSHTVDNDGTFAVQATLAAGATTIAKAEDAAHSSGDVGVFALAVRNDTPDTAVAGTNADYAQISVSSTGAVRTAPISEDFAALANGPQVKKYYTNAGAVTDGIIWSPAAGKRWYVTDIFIGVSAASTVTLEDDKSGGDEAIFKMEFAANSGWAHTFATPWFSGEDAADLIITTSAGNVYVTVCGYEI